MIARIAFLPGLLVATALAAQAPSAMRVCVGSAGGVWMEGSVECR